MIETADLGIVASTDWATGRWPHSEGFPSTATDIGIMAFGSMLRVDLHTHAADDPWDRIPHTTAELIERAARLGLDALAVTLDDRQLDLTPLAGLARELNVTLLAGIERTIQGRHVLLINFPAGASAVGSFDELAALKARHPRGLGDRAAPVLPARQLPWGAAGQAP